MTNSFTIDPMTKGYVQIYTGGGKGKTTAALGLAMRAAGSGLKVFIGEFIKEPWQYVYATGLLSSFLDNAPTAMVFNEMATPDGLAFATDPFLKAISMGAVFFGAMTYIGNGPNFMVKSIAEQEGVKMPSFFGYMIKFSLIVLLPIYIIVQLLLI